ncbi:hypothetical protein [Halegenticoccus tardaugens]|uniref:hypothetical protein n=1 Tax=Halegenticoccus tardaugens TaxID=2071624 RepID=UPI00100B094E|nr:hypothetical protein [Halegenticoccus tardaugens]
MVTFEPSDADEALKRVESSLNALFVVQVAEEILEAVDFEALRVGEAYERAVDRERLGEALGRPAGRVVAQRMVHQVAGGGLAGILGREIAGQVGALVFRTALRRADPDAVLNALESIAEAPDGGAEDAVIIEVESEEDEE